MNDPDSKTGTWGFGKTSKHSSKSQATTLSSNRTQRKRNILLDPEFFDETEDKENHAHAALAQSEASKHLSAVLRDDAWEVSFAERRPTTGKHLKDGPSFNIYITTVTSALTLTRSRQQLLDFDTQLQKALPIPLESPVATILAGPDGLSTPRKKRQPLLATLSRSFSPAKLRGSKTWTAPLYEKEPNNGSLRSPAAELSRYYTLLAKLPDVKAAAVWKAFFSVQSSNDLESHRVERRVKKIKSDSSVIHGGPNARLSISDVGTPLKSDKGDDHASLESLANLAEQFLGSQGVDSVDTPSLTRLDPSPVAIPPPVNIAKQPPLPPPPAAPLKPAIDDMVVDLPPRPATTDPSPTESRLNERIDLSTSVSANDLVPLVRTERRRTSLEDFEIIRVLGRGCAGKVLLVRHHATKQTYALKAIHKHHVLAHRELGHTLTEQSVLKRMSRESSNPFVVKLWWSFHDKDNLFLVLDFHPGGDLATQLARWGRLGRDRARFYSAEIAEGLSGLHEAGVIYRDLKPENVLIGRDGHIVLTDFGLSKQFDRPSRSRDVELTGTSGPMGDGELNLPAERRADRPEWMKSGRSYSTPPSAVRETCTTFCGTAEYLAPEVLLGEPYSYECDAWSFGTMLFEMLTGMTPFWATDHTTMYRRVLHDELQFEDDGYLDSDTKSILRGLLQKNPLLRMSDARIRRHPYFGMIDWGYIRSRRYIPPYVPALNPDDELDTSNFDALFLSMTPVVHDPTEVLEEAEEDPEKEPKIPQAPTDEFGNDVFCGYSFRGTSDDEDDIDSLPSFDEAAEHGDKHESDHAAESSDVSTAQTTPDNSQETKPEEFQNDQVMDDAAAVDSQQATALSVDATEPVDALCATPSRDMTTELVVVEEDEWEQVENEGEEARNGQRAAKGGTFFSKGIKDKYVLAVREAVRPTPKRSSSRRGTGILLQSRQGSRSSSTAESNSAPESPSTKRIKPDSNFLASPLKMKMRSSRTSLRSRSKTKSDSPEDLQRNESFASEATPRATRQNTTMSDDVEALKLPKTRLFSKRASAILPMRPKLYNEPSK